MKVIILHKDSIQEPASFCTECGQYIKNDCGCKIVRRESDYERALVAQKGQKSIGAIALYAVA